MHSIQHPADAYQATIFHIDNPSMKELCEPVEGVVPENAREKLSRFKIRMASNPVRQDFARMLVQKMYSNRGYDTDDAARPAEDPPPSQLTLIASAPDETPLGTMSVIFDSGNGLPADAVYKDLLDPLRREGRRLIEVGRLAIDRTEASRRLFAGMVHVILIYASAIHRYTDMVIEVNPRHVGYYRKILKFEIIGEARHCPRVNATAVLMHIKIKDMLGHAKTMGGQGHRRTDEKSLYPYFFSPQDALGILARVLADQLR
ncbi:hypothetical protein GALL_354900 [mine drainage metagenome]|uniref:N-acyl amino acid synthase FeeM catalytic core domain-containing protein n=1 Tax=mine drainage metagenome TaxID=410659 RepID=A0A1J5R3I6_9ZZZZ